MELLRPTYLLQKKYSAQCYHFESEFLTITMTSISPFSNYLQNHQHTKNKYLQHPRNMALPVSSLVTASMSIFHSIYPLLYLLHPMPSFISAHVLRTKTIFLPYDLLPFRIWPILSHIRYTVGELNLHQLTLRCN